MQTPQTSTARGLGRCLAGAALALLLAAPSFAAPSFAAADESPTTASDGLFVGARLEPGGALALAWDIDVYLTGDRVLSLGPAASIAFLGTDGADLGRRQDALLAIDFLRFKVALNGGHDRFRPYLAVGGGIHYAWLPAQRSGPREVILLPDETEAMAELRYEEAGVFGGLLSLGGGADLYFADNFGIAVSVIAHLRLSGEERVPLFWAETLVGIRFGL